MFHPRFRMKAESGEVSPRTRTFPESSCLGTVSEEDRTENYPRFQFEIERFPVPNRDNTRPMAGQDKIFSHCT
jgi:hypothetical protein